MTREAKDRPLPVLLRRVPRHETNPDGHTGGPGAGNAQPATAAAPDRRGQGDTEEHRGRRHEGGLGRADPASAHTPWRRLGPLEYTLLAVIALALAITIAMAVIDPSG
jgi:hypothetical protein